MVLELIGIVVHIFVILGPQAQLDLEVDIDLDFDVVE